MNDLFDTLLMSPIGIGFLIVVLIVLFLLFRLSGSSSNVEAAIEPAAQPIVETPAPTAPPTVIPPPSNDLELIAVITAAIAASMQVQASSIKISSIRRVVSVDTGWAAQARNDLLGSSRVLP